MNREILGSSPVAPEFPNFLGESVGPLRKFILQTAAAKLDSKG